jgi:hypothetical protein
MKSKVGPWTRVDRAVNASSGSRSDSDSRLKITRAAGDLPLIHKRALVFLNSSPVPDYLHSTLTHTAWTTTLRQDENLLQRLW